MDTFAEEHFRNDDAARAVLEGLRWPDGPICPHCGVINHAYPTKRAGVYRCAEKECRKDFTVTMNTPMERSHIALHKWLQAFHLMASSKKGVSARQIHRTLDITYRSAWFMAHRIRECMRSGGMESSMGGAGKIVEADETYFGKAQFGNPKALRLKKSQHDLLVEYRYARERMLILRDYAIAIDHAWANARLPWPDRPDLPDRKPSRRRTPKPSHRKSK